jgi:hypothetical protein
VDPALQNHSFIKKQGTCTPVVPAKAGIHDTVSLVIVKFRSSFVIPVFAGMTGVQVINEEFLSSPVQPGEQLLVKHRSAHSPSLAVDELIHAHKQVIRSRRRIGGHV